MKRYCELCEKHCPVEDLGCGDGRRAYAAEMLLEQMDGDEAEERMPEPRTERRPEGDCPAHYGFDEPEVDRPMPNEFDRPEGHRPPLHELEEPEGHRPPPHEFDRPEGHRPPLHEFGEPQWHCPPPYELEQPEGHRPPPHEFGEPEGYRPPSNEFDEPGDHRPPLHEFGEPEGHRPRSNESDVPGGHRPLPHEFGGPDGEHRPPYEGPGPHHPPFPHHGEPGPHGPHHPPFPPHGEPDPHHPPFPPHEGPGPHHSPFPPHGEPGLHGPHHPPLPPHDGSRGPHPRPPRFEPEELLRQAERASTLELFDMCHRALHRPDAGAMRGQGRVLAILAARGEMSQRELQDALRVAPGSLSELIAKLERKGMLTRARGDDKRSNLLKITDAGREAAERVEAPSDELLSALSDDQREQFAATLKLLLADWLRRGERTPDRPE